MMLEMDVRRTLPTPGRLARGRRLPTGAATALTATVVTTVLATALLAAVSTGPSHASDAGGRERGPAVRLAPVAGSPVSTAEVPIHRGRTRLETEDYTMLGFTWRGPTPRIQVRTRTDAGWAEWQRLEAIAHGPDARRTEPVRGTEPLWVGPSDALQTHVRGRARDLTLVLIDPGALPGDITAGTAAGTATARRSAGPHSAGSRGTTASRAGAGDRVPPPHLLRRPRWGAEESWRNGRPRYNRTIRQVHVHHSATGNGYRRRDVAGIIRGMYRYHTHNLGWSDIGYNFLVDRFGRAWVGRGGGAARPVRGAHTLGFNHASTGIAVIGNFERTDVSYQVVETVARLAAWKLDRYGRNPQGTIRLRSAGSDRFRAGRAVRLPVIDGHRDTNHTACPGARLYERLPRIRWRAAKRIARQS